MNEFFAWVMGIVTVVLPGFGQPAAPVWNGYAEADYVYVSAASPGTIASIAVKEGDAVAKGQVLFTLNAVQQQALADAAKARVDAAQANLDNLLTGSRSEEVDVIRASLEKAKADLALAQQSFTRAQQLFERGVATQAQLDQAKATLAAAEAQVTQLEAQLKVAELPARDAQQIAAEANLAAAKADAARADADLVDRTVTAPMGGRVERLYFDAGEMAAAGVPVLSLSGAGSLKIKFYLNEADRPDFALGEMLAVDCDGCADGLTATVSYFASDPQFTPPIIYSRDERNRLVFLAEATMNQQNGILPGQPVNLRPMK
ncbi:MAG TPA: HlyD family efflux transporter periplasmic adaptor subunit [Devosia sp.]|nr:HlyD family efflux transporter periplasmic adaptor subunit [Devosia sp.]